MIFKMPMNLSSFVFLGVLSACSLTSALFLLFSNIAFLVEWEFCLLNGCPLVMTIIFDWMSMMFSGFVLFISSMILYYSGEYMKDDKNFNRFMYLVILFVCSMILMIVSPNLISILLGWDGLGLVSYCLVIYYQNEKSSNSGMITVLSNRVGDVAVLMSIGLMCKFGGWNFMLYSSEIGHQNMLLMIMLVMVAGMTKSAQIPFSAWLPAAMAAPTPVSALVHSSTLVTAGVYLLIRFSPALMESSVSTLLLLISCLTMFMAGLGANFEYDLKKIIALSTLSQLGVMMSILSLGLPDLAFFHLLTHALFKALLFMCAGMIIHSMKECQDIRRMGSLIYSMPLTSSLMTLSNLALCGMPFMSGFYSKDLILEVAFMSNINMVAFVLYVLATGLTVCYTFRLVFYIISGDPNISSFISISDSSTTMTNPSLMLATGAVVMGSVLSWLLFPESYMICLSFFLKVLALAVSLLGGVLGYMFNFMNMNYNLKSIDFFSITSFAGSMWFLPHLSGFLPSSLTLKVGSKLKKNFDGGWLEYLGGQGGYSVLMQGSAYVEITQDKTFKVFMKTLFFWVIIFLIMLY
ncbi:NADH dehydrogenase subunit 5 (mitochondrion) [Panulirus ornatus]|uniref:NADH-ubiquinone oxidoreductase chain 5 n=1 Tax=Panulirus ornatus TaxID=150431 RepID=E7BJW1_9EUCA|nr:NADH dehydrogenase subunit 5 [Panulirus ornatus]ACS15254.1 NADH dehydrogenase subunit 5 [Panulirus ornatus]